MYTGELATQVSKRPENILPVYVFAWVCVSKATKKEMGSIPTRVYVYLA